MSAGGGKSLGLYVSVPFCRAKCSFCNFASDAFAPARMGAYVDRLRREMDDARAFAEMHGAVMPEVADTLYFGGGTPSLLPAELVERMFAGLRDVWRIDADAEITMEAAPGQIADEALEAMLRAGVNRVSMGVQSFVNAESAAVGRLHTRADCLAEIERLRGRGLGNVGIDLICGLPHQTRASWRESIEVATESGVEHVSLYMLEVDEDSRLGRELIGGGVRYRAGLVPHEDVVAEMYTEACEVLAGAGVMQYEISNFAREGFQSRHNRRYWERAPYVGLGLDAHSMLLDGYGRAVRFANGDSLDEYVVSHGELEVELVDEAGAFEECVFLGLRLLEGLSVSGLRERFGPRVDALVDRAAGLSGLVDVGDGRMRLTAAGRVVSSSVFGELLAS